MFVEANRQRKARVIFGSGVGPLHSNRLRQMVGAICQMTTAGFLRDDESREYAIRLGGSELLGCACDPALAYIQRWAANFTRISHHGSEPLRIAGLVRANTNEYIVDMSGTELKDFNARTARQIAQILEPVCQAHRAKVDLLPMHAIWIGGDDRIFNRLVASSFSNSDIVRVERRYLPLETLLQSLSSADVAVAMRYHGHLFCMALGIPFLSIDYTGKPGKVHSLIQRIEYQQWSEDWRNIDMAHAASRLQQLLEERVHWSAYLQQQTDKLVAELHKTYTQVFGVPEEVR
jgi:polysaccharide pyruvyl transferase WcaK-like protein